MASETYFNDNANISSDGKALVPLGSPLLPYNSLTVGAPPSTNFSLPPSINTVDASRATGSTITTPVVPPSTAGAGLSSLVTTTADNIKTAQDKANADLQTSIDAARKRKTELGGSLSDLYNQIGGLATKEDTIYANTGVFKAQQNVNDINTLIRSETASSNERLRQLREGGGNSVASFNGEAKRIQDESSYRLANYGIALSAANSDWTNAQNIANQQIKMITEPLKNALDQTKYFYEQNQNDLTTKESKLYETKIEQLSTALKVETDAAVKLQDAKNEAMKTAQTQGASSDVLVKIQSAKTYDELGNATGQVFNPTTPGSGAGSAAMNVATKLGVSDTSQPLVNVISTYGIGAVVDAMIGNEGGSPKGVQNNPGNIKYAGLPGQTDSGVKATDGGTFASYATPQAGKDAIGTIITNAATGKSAAYGQNVSFQDFVNKYTNTAPSAKPTYGQYGLLANTDFNSSNKLDKGAMAYLNYYIKNATYPTSYNLGGKGTFENANFGKIADRAQDLYYKATGSPLPDVQVLKGNKTLITGNNKLLNNLNVQEGTIAKNFKLAVDNLETNKLNQDSQPINAFMNSIKNMLGDPDVATYLTQNATLSNEVSSLLALKNASGTTVADKLEAAGLVPKNASEKQQKAILKILIQEAENARTTLEHVNGDLYSKIDPLQQLPENPNRVSSSNSSTGSGGSTYKGITLPN